MATASKALTALQNVGLARSVPGVGTIVGVVEPPSPAPPRRRRGTTPLSRGMIVAPEPPPAGWRRRLETAARLQWTMYQHHPWLAQATSFTRPLLAPRALAHTEWVMRALDGLGLDPVTAVHVHATIAAHVRGLAVNLEPEAEAVAHSGVSGREWMEGPGRTGAGGRHRRAGVPAPSPRSGELARSRHALRVRPATSPGRDCNADQRIMSRRNRIHRPGRGRRSARTAPPSGTHGRTPRRGRCQ
jgi:Tetracyclin repressor-like, C-terminal domain